VSLSSDMARRIKNSFAPNRPHALQLDLAARQRRCSRLFQFRMDCNSEPIARTISNAKTSI